MGELEVTVNSEVHAQQKEQRDRKREENHPVVAQTKTQNRRKVLSTTAPRATAVVLMAAPCTKSLEGGNGVHKHGGGEERKLCWKSATVS